MENQGKIIGYDPMTGEPIYEEAAPTVEKKIVGYDPMTGEPIYEEAAPTVEKKIVGYDPMTGEPIYEEAAPTVEKKIVGYDPMTGQPIYEQEAGNATGYTNVAGDANQQAPKKKTGFIIGGVAAAVALVVVALLVAFMSGAFMSPAKKVAYACANTIKEGGEITKALSGFKILESDKYTVALEGSVKSYGEMKMEYRNSSSLKQFEGNVDVSGYPDIDFVGEIDKQALKVQVPAISDYVFYYNYKDKKDGYIVDQVGEDVIASIDESLSTVFSEKEQAAEGAEVAAIFAEFYNGLEFKAVDAAKYEVDGKDRKCKGYKTIVTEDDMDDLVDNFEEWFNEKYEDALKQAGESMDDSFDELREAYKNMDEVELTFYVYKKQLACLAIEIDGDELSCVFHGGKFRTQNIEVLANDKTEMEIIGDIEGTEETTKVKIEGSTICKVVYDSKSGDYKVTVEDGSDSYDVRGTLKCDDKQVELTIDELDVGDSTVDSFEASMVITKGADFTKISGDQFDVGNSDEDDFKDIIEEVYKKFY